MQLTPEIKAQLTEQKKQCIFCKLISGEMPAKTVFEDDITISMVDIYPAIKGHITFMPKEHYPIMPYIPAEEFKHLFGLIPQLSGVLKRCMVTTGVNVFIANGGAAGQQASHFSTHIFPREEGDNFFNFWLNKKDISLEEDKIKMLTNNLPIMMQNHFGRNPADWHSGKGENPNFLKNLEGSTIYEDEKVVCIIPKKGVAAGHVEIYSKTEEKYIENLSILDSNHFFFTASFAATAIFEGLGAQATNIILKSGESDDNPEGKLCVHVIPRNMEDGLNDTFLWKPKQPSYDLDSIKNKIKDKTWTIKYQEENRKKEQEKKEPVVAPTPVKIGDRTKSPLTPEEEIKSAIEKMRGD